MGKKLYCGNLSYNVASSDLDQIFGEYGTVQSAEVIMDRDTGRSRLRPKCRTTRKPKRRSLA